MKSIGIIGTDNGHAHMYSAIINGWTADEPLPLRNGGRTPDPAVHIWGQFVHRLDLGDFGGRDANVRVSRIWSADPGEAERIARACSVEHISPTPADAAVDVDAVMVLSEDPTVHFEHARAALERGLPTYIDKPMTQTTKDAEVIFEFAEAHEAPCFTGSTLRFAPELHAARDAQRRLLGKTLALYIHCPMSIPLYVSHSLEIMNLFLGHDIQWVQALQANDRQLVTLQERSGASVVLDHVNIGAHPRYSGTLHGSDTYLPFSLTQLGETALAFIREFTRFTDTRITPCQPTESVALMRLRDAAITSLRRGQRITIHPTS